MVRPRGRYVGQFGRRRFVSALGALSLPWAAGAQVRKGARPFRIGLTTSMLDGAAVVALMRSLGWTHERDYVLVESGLPYGTLFEVAVRRTLAQQPDVILTTSTTYALEARRLTTTIPIVMVTSGYPVEAGVAGSLARPGGNITGNTSYAGAGIWGKLFQLMMEAKPGTRRFGLLWDYVAPLFPQAEIDAGMGELRADANALGVELHFAEVRRTEEVFDRLAELQRKNIDALQITNGPAIWPRRHSVVEYAIARVLPTITEVFWPPSSEPGPLITYGALFTDQLRQAIGYVDRILRGVDPGELPIQQPTRFALAVNLKTARAIGLELPSALLLRADHVIE